MHLDPDGQGLCGKPKKWWMDCIKEDMECMGLTMNLPLIEPNEDGFADKQTLP